MANRPARPSGYRLACSYRPLRWSLLPERQGAASEQRSRSYTWPCVSADEHTPAGLSAEQATRRRALAHAPHTLTVFMWPPRLTQPWLARTILARGRFRRACEEPGRACRSASLARPMNARATGWLKGNDSTPGL